MFHSKKINEEEELKSTNSADLTEGDREMATFFSADVSYNVVYHKKINEPEHHVRYKGDFPFEHGRNPLDPELEHPPKYIEFSGSREQSSQDTQQIMGTSDFDELTFSLYRYTDLADYPYDDKDEDNEVVTEKQMARRLQNREEVLAGGHIVIPEPEGWTRGTASISHYADDVQRGIQNIAVGDKLPPEGSHDDSVEYVLDLYSLNEKYPLVYRPGTGFNSHCMTNGFMYQVHYRDTDDNFLLIYQDPVAIVPLHPNVQELTISRSVSASVVGHSAIHDSRRNVITENASIHFAESYASSGRISNVRRVWFKKLANLPTSTEETTEERLSQYETDVMDSCITIEDAEFDRVNERIVIFYSMKLPSEEDHTKETEEKALTEPLLSKKGEYQQSFVAARKKEKEERREISEPTYKELMSVLFKPGVIHVWMQAREDVLTRRKVKLNRHKWFMGLEDPGHIGCYLFEPKP